MRLTPGYSLDLTMNDPKTGKPWDLGNASVQSRVLRLVRDTKPYFVIGSPPCTPFSPLQEISRAKRDPKIMAEEYRKGLELIRFCIKVTHCSWKERGTSYMNIQPGRLLGSRKTWWTS